MLLLGSRRVEIVVKVVVLYTIKSADALRIDRRLNLDRSEPI
jgi:hypothetical protein